MMLICRVSVVDSGSLQDGGLVGNPPGGVSGQCPGCHTAPSSAGRRGSHRQGRSSHGCPAPPPGHRSERGRVGSAWCRCG
ncbi:MAG: hypothetical protein ACO388_07500 [Saprospiraceae bacterium]